MINDKLKDVSEDFTKYLEKRRAYFDKLNSSGEFVSIEQKIAILEDEADYLITFIRELLDALTDERLWRIR